jgi:hypothetical protein
MPIRVRVVTLPTLYRRYGFVLFVRSERSECRWMLFGVHDIPTACSGRFGFSAVERQPQLRVHAWHVACGERRRVATPQAPAVVAESPDVGDDELPAAILAEHGCLHRHPL